VEYAAVELVAIMNGGDGKAQCGREKHGDGPPTCWGSSTYRERGKQSAKQSRAEQSYDLSECVCVF